MEFVTVASSTVDVQGTGGHQRARRKSCPVEWRDNNNNNNNNNNNVY